MASTPAQPEIPAAPEHSPVRGIVFISYARVDGTQFATKLHDDLESAGVNAFLDERDIKPGQNIELVLRSNLMNARAILVVLSPGTVLSDFVGGEMFQAYEDSIPLIPLLVKDASTSPSTRALKWIDFRDDYRAAFDLLLNSLATLEQDWIGYLQQRLQLMIEQQKHSDEPKRFEAKIQRLQSTITNRTSALRPGGITHTGNRLSSDAGHVTGDARRTAARNLSTFSGASLPDIATHFHDRQAQTGQLKSLLSNQTTRIVTILGRGGIGKTALVANVLLDPAATTPFQGIACLSARTRGGITLEEIFIALGGLLETTAAKRVAEGWSKPYLDVTAKAILLLNELTDGRYVLLLDNIESLLDKSSRFIDKDLQTFIEACLAVESNLVILLTSRVPLALRKELLIFDRQIVITEGLPEADAITMLRDLDVSGRFGLAELSDARLRPVVALVKGLPRALELVAYMLASDPLASLEELLDPAKFFHSDDVLQELVVGAYSRVDQDSLIVLQVLSVFGRMVPQSAIEFLVQPFGKSAGVRDMLRYLVQTHVVSFSRDTGMYDLHPLDREYLLRSLPATGEYCVTALHRCAADYYLQLRKPQDEWLTPLDLRPQFLEFQHRMRANQQVEAHHLLASMDENYLEVWGYNPLLVRMRRELATRSLPSDLQVENLVRLARAEHRLGHFEAAIETNQQARAIARSGGDSNGEATCLNYIGNNYYFLGRYRLAIQFQDEALTLVGNDRRREAACLKPRATPTLRLESTKKPWLCMSPP